MQPTMALVRRVGLTGPVGQTARSSLRPVSRLVQPHDNAHNSTLGCRHMLAHVAHTGLRLSRVVLASAALIAVTCTSAHANGFVGTTTITFDGYDDGISITNQYETQGIIFSGTSPDELPFIAWDSVSLT